VTFVEAARALAQRTLLSPTVKDDSARLRLLFRRCTARYPETSEVAVLIHRLAVLRTLYGQDTDAAKRLIAVGESKADPTLAPDELAAWTSIGLLVLNLDETLTKE
jgi:hypothetical protein